MMPFLVFLVFSVFFDRAVTLAKFFGGFIWQLQVGRKLGKSCIYCVADRRRPVCTFPAGSFGDMGMEDYSQSLTACDVMHVYEVRPRKDKRGSI
jgi:hypothetical protein